MADERTKDMTHAEKVRYVLAAMRVEGITMDDLELFGHIQSRDDLNVTAESAFLELIDSGFVLNSGDSTHYYQATADYVAEALAERGLVDDGEEREYRVCIEAVDGSGLWQYQFEATSRESAIQQAYESAVEDGLSRGALWNPSEVTVL